MLVFFYSGHGRRVKGKYISLPHMVIEMAFYKKNICR